MEVGRGALVPEARVRRQLGFQHPIAAARLPHRGQQPLAHSLGRELCVEDALGCGRQLLDQIGLGPRSFALPKQRLQAQEFATLSIGAGSQRRAR